MGQAAATLGLYLHIPFCQRKCPYCDFNTYADLRHLYRPLVDALVMEIEQTGANLAHPTVGTIFVGGGTPTVLPQDALASLLEACRRAFRVEPGAEVTSEANPGTVDLARFEELRQSGVNRLSMGAQSFDDDELRFLGRVHSAEDIGWAFDAARHAGFDNINLDLIFGLPEQRSETWAHTLRNAIHLAPEHLSCYGLTIEDGTPLADWVMSDRVSVPDDDEAADMYEVTQALLSEAGYQQYEISNWCGQDEATRCYRCRHNLIYWRNQPYLGFGPGAHSSMDGRRWWNLKKPGDYVRRIVAGKQVVEGEETIDRRLAMGETMMLGLRLVEEGVEEARFWHRFHQSMDEAFDPIISQLVAEGLLEKNAGRLRLTRRGHLLGNQVFQRFLP